MMMVFKIPKALWMREIGKLEIKGKQEAGQLPGMWICGVIDALFVVIHPEPGRADYKSQK